MKHKLVGLILLLNLNSVYAGNFYFSASTGNDANSGTESAPWQTISKFNATSFNSGDHIYFKRNDIFYGSIVISQSGLTFGAYGTGSNPVITGFTNVINWTNVGSNIWESTDSVSSLGSVNVVTVNGVNTPMGRYPDSGYLTYQSFVNTSSITSNSLTGYPDWTGAEVVIKKERWIIDRNVVSSQSGATLNYVAGGNFANKNSTNYSGQNNFGFFIQNDVRTLDSQNEWYYNPSTKKIRIYSVSQPTDVRVSSIDTLVYAVYKNNITFQNIDFTGADGDAFYMGSCQNATISDCTFSHCYNGMIGENFGGSSDNFVFNNNLLQDINNRGLVLSSEFTHGSVSYNTFSNIGLFPGMGGSGDGQYSATGLYGKGKSVQHNILNNIGYTGLDFNDDSINCSYNMITNYCLTKDDGGGIYSGNVHTGVVISFNTVINGIGNSQGLPPDYFASEAHGIYLDGSQESGFSILDNNIKNPGYSGIYLHNAHDDVIKNNTIFKPLLYGLYCNNDEAGSSSYNLNIRNNIFVIGDTVVYGVSAHPAAYKSMHDDFSNLGNIDSNYYCRPLHDTDNIMATFYSNWDRYYTVPGWNTYSGLDANSFKSPKALNSADSLIFVYNPTGLSTTTNLPYNYVDAKNNNYNGTITLAPYSSAALFQNGSINIPPASYAGGNGSITLPTNSVQLDGTGTDEDGTVVSYEWSQDSGPDNATFSSTTTTRTIVSDMVAGVYVFRFTVTDNEGATGTSTVQVTVNPPLQLMNSAQSNVSTYGGTDGSVTVNATGGRSPYIYNINFGSYSSANVFSDLAAGTYVIGVKDDLSNTTSLSVTITQPADNVSPVSYAGGNGSITLPTNSVQLDGTGTDQDGTVVSYEWSQDSGPDNATFSSTTTTRTIVSDMVAGVYVFRFTVTDNEGATGTSTVQVTVNPPLQLMNSAQSNVSTYGGTDGSVTVNATGGRSPYIYNINSGSYSSGNVFSGLAAGTYIIGVKDDLSNTTSLSVTITQPADNVPPVSYAGGNGSITLPANSVQLDGTGTDQDGTVVSYEWSQDSGPDNATFSSTTTTRTIVSDMVAGVYVFRFTVTDNDGATGTSTVQITVYPPLQQRIGIQTHIFAYGNPNPELVQSDKTLKIPVMAGSEIQFKAWPNPFSSSLSLLINNFSFGRYTLFLLDASGKIIYSINGEKNSLEIRQIINTSNLAAGIYFLQLFQGGNISQIKLIK